MGARTKSGLGILGLLLALLVVGACSADPGKTAPSHGATASATPATGPATTQAAPRRASEGSALVALDALPVKGRAPKTGYSRDQFGDGWARISGCDTRDRILKRDLTRKTYAPGDQCAVQSGHLNDPYTAAAITFVRGGGSEVDIDHVVALSDAWQKGARQWSAGKRIAFANDPLNLLSVDAHTNRSKGDGDAATWLPPNKRFRCDYVARQVAVKRKYKAWITRAEHDAIARVLAGCPDETLPSAGPLRVPDTQATPTPTATPAPGGDNSSGNGRHFANCDAVRAAGLAPLKRGTPDYEANPNLDRDHDGLACEG